MPSANTSPRNESELFQLVRDLLNSAEHQHNPLREAMRELLTLSEAQHGRLEKLVRISDGYHQVTRKDSENLNELYDRQLRRLEKLAKISDRYQNSLREISESLREASLRDPLTGIGNRRYLMEQLKSEQERSKRTGKPYCVAILDADHFKRINDAHGHDAGDKLLEHIAEVLGDELREYDVFGRWGGEEFLILFPHTSLDDAISTTTRIRDAIAAIALRYGDTMLTITVSIGLSSHQPGEEYTNTLKRADDALYQAKASGRNSIEVLI